MNSNVYELNSTGTAQSVLFRDPSEHRKIKQLGRESVQATWVPVSVRIPTRIDGTRNDYSDFLHFFPGVLVMRNHVVEMLAPVLDKLGEFLPLQCAEDPLWLFHCMNNVDALDSTRSKVKLFPSGEFWRFESYSFVSERIGSEPVFRIPQYGKVSHLFATESFRHFVESRHLTGLQFDPIWTSR